MRLNKDILRLAAPAILNNITVPLLGLCDTAIAGHLGEVYYLGAIAIGSMMLNVFFWLSGFLRMGTTGLTARSLGERNDYACRDVLRKSLLIAVVISAIVLIFREPLLGLFVRVINPGVDVREYAELYFRIGVAGVPAQLMVMAVSGWFIGLQTTVIPMTIAIGTNIINILASLLFAFGFGWGFEGIIYGTLCANWIGALAALLWAFLRYAQLRRNQRLLPQETNRDREKKGSINISIESAKEKGIYTNRDREKKGSIHTNSGVRWSELFSVNGALFVRSACIMGVTMTVTAVGARLGETTLAANAVIMQFFLFFSYFMDGFAFSGEALTGKYYGAGDFGMVVATARRLCVWGAVMAAVFLAIYLAGSRVIVSLLTDEPTVIEETMRYKIWIETLPVVTVSAFIFDGLFVGLTRTRPMMWVTIAGSSLFFLILLISGPRMDNNILWFGFEAYLFIRGGALALTFIIEVRRKKNGKKRVN